jgi:hypothetical protein
VQPLELPKQQLYFLELPFWMQVAVKCRVKKPVRLLKTQMLLRYAGGGLV